MSELLSLVRRIEQVDQRISELNDEKSATYEEARFAGLNVKAIKTAVAYSDRAPDVDVVALYNAFNRSPDVSPAEAIGSCSPTRGFVYFATFPLTSRLKIGFTTNWRRRLKDLGNAAGEDCQLRKIIPGDRTLELRALMAFASWRLKGEWFNYTPECAAYVEEFTAEFD